MTTRKNFPSHVKARQERAAERRGRAAKRSPEQQLAILMSRGFENCDEAIRLENWIASQDSGVED